MKSVLKLALLMFMLYLAFNFTGWILKKLIFIAILGGILFLILRFFNWAGGGNQQEAS
ncbi:MAG: hypothetical protein MUE85_16485 [Microscillaceae bacterium]|jgi:hypothetical protein|nr:hypothetical protein [Microscillaceae bacterium]